MSSAVLLLLSLALGFIAGLRSMTPPAAIAWGARLGWLSVGSTSLAFLDRSWVVYSLTALAFGELVADKLPNTPSRRALGPFAGRLVTGGFAGAALAAGHGGSLTLGGVCGALGAVAGTLGGYRARTGLVGALAVPDYVVALAEDVVAVGGALLLVSL